MLIPVSEEPLLEGVVWDQIGSTSTKKQARAMLARTRDALAPQARIERPDVAGTAARRSSRAPWPAYCALGSPRQLRPRPPGQRRGRTAVAPGIPPRHRAAGQDDADAPLERIRVGFNAPPSPKRL